MAWFKSKRSESSFRQVRALLGGLISAILIITSWVVTAWGFSCSNFVGALLFLFKSFRACFLYFANALSWLLPQADSGLTIPWKIQGNPNLELPLPRIYTHHGRNCCVAMAVTV
jgi:hypothetical protein